MAHFYGTVGQDYPTTAHTEASRTGTKKSGIETHAASFSGAIRVVVWYNEETGKDEFLVSQVTWQGAGVSEPIATGVLGQLTPEITLEQATQDVKTGSVTA